MATSSLNVIIGNYLAGNAEVISWWEKLMQGQHDQFWEVICSAISHQYNDIDLMQQYLFLSILIERRLQLFGCRQRIVDCCYPLLLQTVFQLEGSIAGNNTNDMTMKLLYKTSSCLAKFITLSDEASINISSLMNDFCSHFSSQPLSIAIIIDEIFSSFANLNESLRDYIKLLAESETVMNMINHLLSIQYPQFSSARSPQYNKILSITAIKLTSHILASAVLAPSLLSRFLIVLRPAGEMSICEMIYNHIVKYNDDLEILSALTDFIEGLIEVKETYTNKCSSIISPTSSSLDDMVEINAFFDNNCYLLVLSMSANMQYFHEVLTVPQVQQLSIQLAITRLTISTVNLMKSQLLDDTDEYKWKHNTELLQLLLLQSRHNRLEISGPAFEVIVEVLKLLANKSSFNSELNVWINNIFESAFCRSRRSNVETDAEFDEDEWTRIKEQLCSEVIDSCYTFMRADLITKIKTIITECLDCPQDNPQSAVNLETAIFSLRSLSFSLSKRMLLHGASKSAMLNISKLKLKSTTMSNQSADTNGIETDAKISSVLFIQILTSISFSSSLDNYEVRIGICKLFGNYASWMSKAKDVKDDQDCSTVSPMNDVIISSLRYLLSSMSTRNCGHISCSSIRSLTSYCGQRIVEYPNCLEFMMTTWLEFCCLPHKGRLVNNLFDEEFLQHVCFRHEETTYLDGDEEFDFVFEMKKSFLQSICNILKHAKGETFSLTVNQLLSPVISTLQQASNVNVVCDELSLGGLIEILALFIRSVRVPALFDSINKTFTCQSLSTQHPGIMLLSSWGDDLFLQVQSHFPTKKIFRSVCFLMTSITTFLVPLLPDDDMSLVHIGQYIWLDHVKRLIPHVFDAAVDSINEFITILGPICDQQSSVLSQLPAQSLIQTAVKEIIIDMFDTVFTSVLCCFPTNPFDSPRGDISEDAFDNEVIAQLVMNNSSLQRLDGLFIILRTAISLTPRILLSRPWVSFVLKLGAQIISSLDDIPIVRSTALFFRNWFNLGESRLLIDTTDLGFQGFVRQYELLTMCLYDDMFCLTIIQIAGHSNEILVDAFAALFFQMIKFSQEICSGTIKLQKTLVSSDISQLCLRLDLFCQQIADGKLQSRDDQVYLVKLFKTLSVQSISISTSATNFLQFPPVSEFQEFCEQLWKAFSGKTSKDNLQSQSQKYFGPFLQDI